MFSCFYVRVSDIRWRTGAKETLSRLQVYRRRRKKKKSCVSWIPGDLSRYLGCWHDDIFMADGSAGVLKKVGGIFWRETRGCGQFLHIRSYGGGQGAWRFSRR